MFRKSRTLLRAFVSARETKEITVAHAAILLASGLIYLGVGMTEAVIFFIIAMFLEMVGFHILWIYRENPDRDHPIAFAIGVEIANLIIGVLGAFALFVVAVAADHFLNIPWIYTVLVIGVGGFFTYSGYKIRKQIPDDNNA